MNELYRSKTNKMISGVCGGLSEYLSLSPEIVRTLFVIATIMSGLKYGFIIYIAATLLIPEAPVGYIPYSSNKVPFSFNNLASKNTIGIVLILLGLLLTLKRVLDIDDIIIISFILIALGIYILLKGGKISEKE